MPVFTTNSNAIPVGGAERIEILRDGASAIYGADALAGVVNTVLKTDFVGSNLRYKVGRYDLSATDQKLSINGDKTLVLPISQFISMRFVEEKSVVMRILNGWLKMHVWLQV